MEPSVCLSAPQSRHRALYCDAQVASSLSRGSQVLHFAVVFSLTFSLFLFLFLGSPHFFSFRPPSLSLSSSSLSCTPSLLVISVAGFPHRLGPNKPSGQALVVTAVVVVVVGGKGNRELGVGSFFGGRWLRKRLTAVPSPQLVLDERTPSHPTRRHPGNILVRWLGPDERCLIGQLGPARPWDLVPPLAI